MGHATTKEQSNTGMDVFISFMKVIAMVIAFLCRISAYLLTGLAELLDKSTTNGKKH